MIRILTIVGARPQIIKAAALSRAIEAGFSDHVEEVILHTGQHYDDSMSDVFFREMKIPPPRYHLGVGSASHGSQTGQMIEGIEKTILEEKPQGVVLYGDTNSTLAGALAAAKLHIPVIHIEAGLRSFNKQMPEEINRITSDHVSTLLFSPTMTGVNNLKEEGIIHHEGETLSFDRQGVYYSGDVMYDNTLFFREAALKQSTILKELELDRKPYVLATIHRPSNTDVKENLLGILSALEKVAEEHRIPVILPMHPRTRKILNQEDLTDENGIAAPEGLVRFIPAVSFMDMIRLEAGARLILTDSGGVQKEAWFMEKPVVVLREETEWVEIIEAGNGILAGADTHRIAEAARRFMETPPASYPPVFGDGQAAHHILKVITTARWY
ncbi:MAG: UDP-N-acetylglucosamine 2-epimerase (non-hydrolyzing) [Bacteroidota bacterium]